MSEKQTTWIFFMINDTSQRPVAVVGRLTITLLQILNLMLSQFWKNFKNCSTFAKVLRKSWLPPCWRRLKLICRWLTLNNRHQSVGPKPDSRPRLEAARYKCLTSCWRLLSPSSPFNHAQSHTSTRLLPSWVSTMDLSQKVSAYGPE